MKKLIIALVLVGGLFASCAPTSKGLTRGQARADRRAQRVCDDVHNPKLFSGY